METTRQQKIARLLQKELSEIFRVQTAKMGGVLVSVSAVRVSPDLSIARAYLSIFPSERANEIIESIVYGMLFKSIDWAYEREWRIIGLNIETPFMKLPPARKLFLGANIEDFTKERLIAIARKKHIPVFQMYLAPDKYKFEYHQIF